MKKITLSLFIALLSFGSAFAAPKFKGLSNKHGKTIVKIEFPTSDFSQVTVIKDWTLYNDGKAYDVKKVDVKGVKSYTFILEFKKLTKFSDCSLFFTVNGEPVSIDLQSLMNQRCSIATTLS